MITLLETEQPAHLNNRYIAWRHGQSEANVEEKIVSKPENGMRNAPLTEVGFAQVRSSIILASQLGIDSQSLIYSSPFLRCMQTSEEIAKAFGIGEIVMASELRERSFGDFEGESAEAYERVYELDRRFPGHNLYNVESTYEVSQRVTGFLRSLEGRHTGRTIILSTHADVAEILQASLLGLPPYSHRDLPKLRNGEVRQLELAYMESRRLWQ